MQASSPSLIKTVKWYVKGGLFDALSLALAALVLLGLWHSLSQTQSFLKMQWLWVVLDSLLWPLYALQATMHVVRDEKTTVFEINLLGSPWRIALGRLTALFLSQAAVGVVVYAALVASNTSVSLYAVIVKIVLYLAAASLALPLMSRRASFFLLLTLFILLPFTTPVLVRANLTLGSQKLDPVTAVIAVSTTPFYMDYMDKVLPMSYDVLALISVLVLLVLALLSIALFARAEYNV